MSEPLKPMDRPDPEPKGALGAIRDQPARSVVSAFVVGLVLSLFPVGRIISVLLSLGLMLLRPVLLCLGIVKVWEEAGRRAPKRAPEPDA